MKILPEFEAKPTSSISFRFAVVIIPHPKCRTFSSKRVYSPTCGPLSCKSHLHAVNVEMNRQPEKSRYRTILMETLVGLTTNALGAANGSVGTTIVAFIQTTIIVTAELCVGKTGLEKTLLLQVVDFGPARLGLVVIFLGERMDLRNDRQML